MTIFEKTLNDLMNTINRMYSRLEVDISGINCREILIHNKRIDIFKKYLEKFKNEESVVREKYFKYEYLLKMNKQVLGRVVKISFSLIVLLSVFASLYATEAITGVQTLSYIFPNLVRREMLPTVVSSTGLLIGVLSVVFSLTFGLYRKRSILLNREYSLLKKKYFDLINRINIIEREYEKSYKYRVMLYETYLCKCYIELTEFREKIWLINRLINELKNCTSTSCYNHYYNELLKTIVELKEINRLCDTVFTDEYRVSVETMCNVSGGSSLNNCYVKITIRGKEHSLDIGNYLASIIGNK